MHVIPFVPTSFYQFGPRFSLLLLPRQYNFSSFRFPFRAHRDPILMIKSKKKISPMVLTNFRLVKKRRECCVKARAGGLGSREP